VKKPATIDDIARQTKVSKSTVSRALNGSSRISEATHRRILAAAKKLHYEPNYLARNLSRSSTLSVGVILEDIMNPFFTEVAKGIEEVLTKAGYTLLLASSGYIQNTELEVTRTLLRNRVDGILITPVSMESPAVALLKARKLPFFVMNEKSDDADLNWIDSDNRAGGYLAAEHLLQLGHRRFVILRNQDLHGTRDRFEGIRKALDDRRIPLSDQIILDGAATRQEGTRLVDGLIASAGREKLPTALIATNDLVAIGAMESLLAHGISVPNRVSVIGYDDVYLAGLVCVPLTTVHQAKYRMGQIAATGLLQMLDGRQSPRGQQFLIKPRLIIRNSCKQRKQ
jgi:DNA-binding LacI/PurR family transcriptional regulator